MGYYGIPLPSLPIHFLLLQGLVLIAETKRDGIRPGFVEPEVYTYSLVELHKGKHERTHNYKMGGGA